MRLWFSNQWESVRTSFWFLPTVLVAAAILLSLATIHLDKTTPYYEWLATFGWTFSRGPEGSRAVLSVVAGSMMTITSVTFSITIVALQLASSQFGPRLLRNFMRDRGNQIALGTFIATFTYCLLILRTINGTADSQFVPHISVTVGLLLALISLGVLIFFIHHAAESIQAENVIAAVSRDLDEAIDRLFPDCTGEQAPGISSDPQATSMTADFEHNASSIDAMQSDYLQAIDVGRLMEIAVERDVVLKVLTRPGKFVFAGGVLAKLWPPDRADESMSRAIRGAFYLGRRRTLAQDVEFAIDQLVEIAVRALSPGVNDPFTAINCVDRLGAAMCKLAGKELPSTRLRDESDRLRIIVDTSTAQGMIDAAFDQIRQASLGNAAVTLRMFDVIDAIARCTRNPLFLAALRQQAEEIHRGSQVGLPETADQQDASDRYRKAIEALDPQ